MNYYEKVWSWILSYFDEEEKIMSYNGFQVKNKPFAHVLIQSQKVCREVFLQEPARPVGLGLGDLFNRWLGQCMGCLNSNNPAWSKLKKIFKPIFDNKVNNELMEEWRNDLRRLSLQQIKEPSPVEQVVADLPLRAVLRVVFGINFQKQYDNEFQELKNLSSFLTTASFTNYWATYLFYRWLPTETNKKLKRFQSLWNYVLATAAQSEYVLGEGNYHILLQNFGEVCDIVTKDMFKQTLAEIIYANQDVTIPSVASLMAYYALHSDLYSDEEPMNFIEEVARLSPVFPNSMQKTLSRDVEVDGYVMKKGTVVLMDFISLGKSVDWQMSISDLEKFRPNRYKEIGAQDLVSRFGYGGRKCPGRIFANYLLVKMLNMLNAEFILKPTRPMTDDQLEKDKTKTFLMPDLKIWVLEKANTNKNTNIMSMISYDCSYLEEAANNAFIAISVNPRSPYLNDDNTDNVDMVVKHMNNRTKSSVILIADDIAQYNMQAFDKMSPQKAVEAAAKLGDRFVEKFVTSTQKYGPNVTVLRWKDLGYPEDLEGKLQLLLENQNLKDRVEAIATKFINIRGQGQIQSSFEKKRDLVVKYILSELPVLVCGVEFDAEWYRILYYTGTREHLSKFADDKGSLHNMVIDILNNPAFEKVKRMIPEMIGREEKYKVSGFFGIYI